MMNENNAKRQKAPSFRLEIPGDSEVKTRLMDKISEVRSRMTKSLQRPVNHADILETLLDHYLDETADNTPVQVKSTFILIYFQISFECMILCKKKRCEHV